MIRSAQGIVLFLFSGATFASDVSDASPADILNSFLATQPSPLALWVVVIVSIISILWNFYIWTASKRENKRLRKLIKRDDFWFRTIVLPTLVEPLSKFVDENTKRNVQLSDKRFSDQEHKSKEYDQYLTKFNQEREVIIQACYLLTLHSDDLYQKVTSLLDELEDHVTIYCLSRSKPDTQLNQEEIEKLELFNNIFFVTFVKVLEAIKTFHESSEL